MIQKKGLVARNQKGWNNLASHIEEKKYSKVFLFVDEITKTLCLPVFYHKIDLKKDWEIIEIPSGEDHKNISSCILAWEQLSIKGADRNSLIINVGGGMITDLGGFVASTYKRGIDFVNIPTTLLAMVDASIGGKNGIDFGNIKNQIGTIVLAELVVVETIFLETLPHRQLMSGMAEMLKHGLIYSEKSWEKIRALNILNKIEIEELIFESIEIKEEIVSKDPLEINLRKTLNFGHTLGHAIESYCLTTSSRPTLLHGEAIVIGIILATYISSELLGFPKDTLQQVSNKVLSIFPKENFSTTDIEKIIELLIFDKKNRNGQVLFVLLRDIGHPETDCIVPNDLIFRSFDYYKKL